MISYCSEYIFLVLDCWEAHSVAVVSAILRKKGRVWVLWNRECEDHGRGMAWPVGWLLWEAFPKPWSLATDGPWSLSMMLNCICWGHLSLQFWRLHLHGINTFCLQNTRKLFSISIRLKKWNVMIAVFHGLIFNCNAHCFRFTSQQEISFPCSIFSMCTKATFSRPHTARGDKYTFVHTF